MRFEVKQTREKEVCIYKTVYIKKALSKEIEKIAARTQHKLFNNVVVSMIEACLSDGDGH